MTEPTRPWFEHHIHRSLNWNDLQKTKLITYLSTTIPVTDAAFLQVVVDNELSDELQLMNTFEIVETPIQRQPEKHTLDEFAEADAGLQVRSVISQIARCDVYIAYWDPDVTSLQLGFELGQVYDRNDVFIIMINMTATPLPDWINVIINAEIASPEYLPEMVRTWLSKIDIPNYFGTYIARLRQNRGLSQGDLVKLMPDSITGPGVSLMESGRRMPSRRVANQLAKVLNLHPLERQYMLQLAGYMPRILERKELRTREKG